MADDPGVLARKGLHEAFETRDHAAAVALFAPGVVLNSPILGTRFEGIEAVGDLYAGIIDALGEGRLGDYRITRSTALEGGEQLLGFRATARGTRMEGADIIRVDEQGRVVEMTVWIRPLGGLIAFLVDVGPLIARRKGRFHELALRVIGAPLPLIAWAVNRVAPQLVTLR